MKDFINSLIKLFKIIKHGKSVSAAFKLRKTVPAHLPYLYTCYTQIVISISLLDCWASWPLSSLKHFCNTK